MTAPIDKVRGEGNCGRVTDRGEEAQNAWVSAGLIEPPGPILAEAAKLQTATSSIAGSTWRSVPHTSQCRSQLVAQG